MALLADGGGKRSFMSSFNRINELSEQAPEEVQSKMSDTFATFCTLVEQGVKDSLATNAVAHGSTSRVPDLERSLSNTSLVGVGGGGGGVVAVGEAPSAVGQPTPLASFRGPVGSAGRLLLQQRTGSAAGSLNSLHLTGPGRQADSPSLINRRNLRRVSSGRVRPVGRTAACYFSREGYKVKFTIEARLRSDDGNGGSVGGGGVGVGVGGGGGGGVGIGGGAAYAGGAHSPMQLDRMADTGGSVVSLNEEHEAAAPTAVASGEGTLGSAGRARSRQLARSKTLGASSSSSSRRRREAAAAAAAAAASSDGPAPTIAEQAQDVRDAITSMMRSLPPLIPGTPVIIVFNAIVVHTGGSPSPSQSASSNNNVSAASGRRHEKAFTWQTQTATLDGRYKIAAKQAGLEASYRMQGVDLASTTTAAEQRRGMGRWFGGGGGGGGGGASRGGGD
ncbi:hypothetical protein DFJ73DRAFT_959731 [Zopfochytrium polystomum]|nr:hypothetical protein DFJ73DRAFT_959731 [Zopfochytrium polystomum]